MTEDAAPIENTPQLRYCLAGNSGLEYMCRAYRPR